MTFTAMHVKEDAKDAVSVQPCHMFRDLIDTDLRN